MATFLRRVSCVALPSMALGSRPYLLRTLNSSCKCPFFSAGKQFNSKRLFSSSSTYHVNAMKKDNKTVQITWGDGHVGKFHLLWLRDHCRCSLCVEPSSNQKLFQRSSLVQTPQINHLELKPEVHTVSIVWDDGHKSDFDYKWLRNQCYSEKALKEARERVLPKLWNNSNLKSPPVVSFEEVMRGDRGVWSWLSKLNYYGLCIVRDVPTELGMVEKVGERVTYLRETMYGRTWRVESVEEPNNVAYSAFALPPHQDLCYYESPPGIQMLHCLKFDTIGGDNQFVDGFQVVDDLAKEHPMAFESLTTTPVTFMKSDETNYLHYRRPTIVLGEDGLVTGINYSPTFEGPLRVPFEKVEPFYEAYNILTELIKKEKYQLTFRMKPGDLVSFNNRRVFHSRTSYDPSKPRLLEGAYLDMDEFASKLRVLRRNFGDEMSNNLDSTSSFGSTSSSSRYTSDAERELSIVKKHPFYISGSQCHLEPSL